MRIPLITLALAVSAFAADAPDEPQAAPAPAPAAAPATPAPKYGGWVFGGLVDGYITGNNNTPDSNLNQLQNFDIMYGQPLLSLAKFTIDKSDSQVGIHADIGFGETMRLIHAFDPAAQDHQALRYFEQMYAILKPKALGGMEIDYGQFVTAAGAEVIESSSNWNYSRSILFGWAIPYYHFGLRMNMPITKAVTLGVQLVNPWNEVDGDHRMTNLGITLAATGKAGSLNVNYYTGPNNPGTTTGKRNLLDGTALLNLNDKLSMYVNGDFGSNGHASGKGSDSWYGVAGAVRYQAFKKVAVAERIESFNDKDGFETGAMQTVWENTITGEYKHNDHLLTRLEFRHDSSNLPYFDKNSKPASEKSMNTLTFGVVVTLGPWK